MLGGLTAGPAAVATDCRLKEGDVGVGAEIKVSAAEKESGHFRGGCWVESLGFRIGDSQLGMIVR